MDIETNIQIIVCLSKTVPLCNKKHLSNIWKKNVAYKKKLVADEEIDRMSLKKSSTG